MPTGSIERIINKITVTIRDIAPENLSSTHVIREVKKNLDAELAKKQWKKVTVAGAVGSGGF